MALSDKFAGELRAELERIKKDSFVDTYQASDTEAMGLLLSRFYQWDGIDIMEAAKYALEDANFHTESGQLADMRKAALADFEPATVRAVAEHGDRFGLEMQGGPEGHYFVHKLNFEAAVRVAGSALGNIAVARELLTAARDQGWARATVGGARSQLQPREAARS